ncbi:MAG TPA: hypothetical protein VFF30_09900 [Nitrososphaerales archaeon]|nr:hypothetical protein [Nitrososphaerales archaeon]
MVVQFNSIFPVLWVDVAAAVTVLIIALGVVYKLRRWIRVLPSGLIRDAKKYIGSSGLVGLFFSELGNRVLIQRNVLTDSKSRKIIHLMIFWGFLGLAFATVWDDIFFRNGTLPSPGSLENFGNIIGNIGGVVLLIGIAAVVLRYAAVEKFRKNYKGDLFFLAFLYLATITGFATEVSRFSTDPFADINYLIHLGFIGALFITAPFTHFFHALLTPIMRYAERIHTRLVAKGADTYPFYRKMQMADLAEDIRSGATPPTFPVWLESGISSKGEKDAKKENKKSSGGD